MSFRNFCGLAQDFIKLLGGRPLFFGFYLGIRENRKNCGTTTRICGNICTEDLFFLFSVFTFLV